jgi:hypothetical protein
VPAEGNRRVIYEILETAGQVEVIAIQHRADAYRWNPAWGRRDRSSNNAPRHV